MLERRAAGGRCVDGKDVRADGKRFSGPRSCEWNRRIAVVRGDHVFSASASREADAGNALLSLLVRLTEVWWADGSSEYQAAGGHGNFDPVVCRQRSEASMGGGIQYLHRIAEPKAAGRVAGKSRVGRNRFRGELVHLLGQPRCGPQIRVQLARVQPGTADERWQGEGARPNVQAARGRVSREGRGLSHSGFAGTAGTSGSRDNVAMDAELDGLEGCQRVTAADRSAPPHVSV